MLNIVIFGAPGSGKGTQSERIVEKVWYQSHLNRRCIARRNQERYRTG